MIRKSLYLMILKVKEEIIKNYYQERVMVIILDQIHIKRFQKIVINRKIRR